MLSNRISGRKNERGAVLFIVAAGMVVFLLFAGLAIDLSMLHNVKTDLQNDGCVSSGRLHAAQWNGDGINRAVTEAVGIGNKYHFNTTPVALAGGDVASVSVGTAVCSPGCGSSQSCEH
jgi:hypothetical protein